MDTFHIDNRKIRHPNLLLLTGYCRKNEDLWLLSPYIKGSNLEKLIFARPPPFQVMKIGLYDIRDFMVDSKIT